MAASTEIKVVVDVPQMEAIRLMQCMATEILSCYVSLDEVATMLGLPPFPRNEELIKDVDSFVTNLKPK